MYMYLVWLSSLLLALSLLDFLQDTQTLVLDDHPAEGGGGGGPLQCQQL